MVIEFQRSGCRRSAASRKSARLILPDFSTFYEGVKKPSVCNAVSILEQGDFLVKDEDHFLHLTEKGREMAETIYERHCYFKNWLIEAGVEDAIAEQEACRIEHDISEQSFQKLKKWKELGHSEETNGD